MSTVPQNLCTVDGCDRIHVARGFCNTHWRRHREGLPLDTPIRRQVKDAKCEHPGCSRKHKSKGYCDLHYKRSLEGRDLDAPLRGETPPRLCDVEGCGRKHSSHGYCGTHWRWVQVGKPLTDTIQPVRKFGTCLISGCERTHSANGCCMNHKHLCRKYNLTNIQYMMIQEAGCELCGASGVMHIDHDHACCPGSKASCGNCIRGGLCDLCNKGLGQFKDNIEVMEKAVAYLRRSEMRSLKS